MMPSSSPYAVSAVYTPQKIPRMQGNALIEALPPSLSDGDLAQSLALLPEFAPQQRDWDAADRIQMIKGLSNAMIPLDCHIELARTVDTMIREGYVSRPLHSAARQQKLQEVYTLHKSGTRFSQAPGAVAVQDSVALIGMPGMGKSTTIRRALARYPQVIDHGDGVVQLPYIHIDMTSNGTSVKSLAIAIISQIDRLLPACGYAQLYLLSTGRTSTEALLYAAARLVAIHHVGIIVADEVQNLSPTKGVQTVMTELVTMCNMLAVPLIFIGTYKAQRILGADFRSSRRATGPLSVWGPMPRFDSGVLVPRTEEEPSQWRELLDILWQFQWVRQPAPLTADLVDYLHDRTQGVIDLLIKLFSIAQVRAIASGVETLSRELFDAVYEAHFGLLHEALEAMRKPRSSDRSKALERFADVAPLDLNLAIAKTEAGGRLKAQATEPRALRPGQPGFADKVETLLVEGGLESDAAKHLAQEADRSGKAEGPLEAVARIVKEVRPKRLPKPSIAQQSGNVVRLEFSAQPSDYRRAAALAAQQRTSVVEQLKALGMLRDAEELVPLI